MDTTQRTITLSLDAEVYISAAMIQAGLANIVAHHGVRHGLRDLLKKGRDLCIDFGESQNPKFGIAMRAEVHEGQPVAVLMLDEEWSGTCHAVPTGLSLRNILGLTAAGQD